VPEEIERDTERLRRVKADDATAFEEIFHDYYGRLCAFARTITYADDVATDVVDDVFATMWLQRGTLEIRTTLAGYLYRAVRNGALNARRDRTTHETLHARWLSSETSLSDDASATVEREELSHVIDRLLAALPERRRVAVTLRWRAGLSHAEIAEILGVNVQSVANLLNRALHDLRRMLPEDFL